MPPSNDEINAFIQRKKAELAERERVEAEKERVEAERIALLSSDQELEPTPQGQAELMEEAKKKKVLRTAQAEGEINHKQRLFERHQAATGSDK